MSASSARHFDALAFVKRSKELGVKEELAEYQARQLDQLIDLAVAINKEDFNAHELATKVDLNQQQVVLTTEIKQLEVDLKVEIKRLEVTIKQLEVDLRTEIKQLEVELRTEIKRVEGELRAEIKRVEGAIKENITQLEIKIEKYRYEALKFTVWTGIGVIVFLSGLLAKGFHWLS